MNKVRFRDQVVEIKFWLLLFLMYVSVITGVVVCSEIICMQVCGKSCLIEWVANLW